MKQGNNANMRDSWLRGPELRATVQDLQNKRSVERPTACHDIIPGQLRSVQSDRLSDRGFGCWETPSPSSQEGPLAYRTSRTTTSQRTLARDRQTGKTRGRERREKGERERVHESLRECLLPNVTTNNIPRSQNIP